MKNKGNFLDNNIIRWIIGIVVILHIFFLLSATYGVIEAGDSLSDLTADFRVYEKQENSIESLLSDKGYEVLTNVYIFNYTTNSPFFEWYDIEDDTICDQGEEYCYTNKVAVDVIMKSFGSRNKQIWDTLTSANVVFPDAYVHWITIKYPIETCIYTIFGVSQYFETYDSEVRELIQKQIDEYGKCS